MQSHARVVIIGGGIMGVGLLYHLAEAGWDDCVLIEKAELTSGSTWHAAGQCPNFTSDYNVAKIQHYSNLLYAKLEKLTGPADEDRPVLNQSRSHRAVKPLRGHNARPTDPIRVSTRAWFSPGRTVLRTSVFRVDQFQCACGHPTPGWHPSGQAVPWSWPRPGDEVHY